MKPNMRNVGEDTHSHRPFRAPRKVRVRNTAPAAPRRDAAGSASPSDEVMPRGVFAAYAAALVGIGFLFVIAMSGGIRVG